MTGKRWSDPERALQAAIRACPEDDLARLAYADWLEERGRDGAALLRALVAHRTTPDRAPHVERLDELRSLADPLWLAAIGDTRMRLAELAARIDGRLADDYYFYDLRQELVDRGELRAESLRTGVAIYDVDGLLDLEIDEIALSDPNGDRALAALVGSPSVAPAIRSLYVYGLSAENGVVEIDLEGILAGDGVFSSLTRFATNFDTQGGACLIGGFEGENGQLARLLAKCPVIADLTIPSDPSPEFFEQGTRPLTRLSIKGGFPPQGFLRELANSSCFPYLEIFEYREDLAAGLVVTETASVDDLCELVTSPAFKNVHTIRLSEMVLTPEEIAQILRARSDGVTIERSRFSGR